MSTTEEMVAEVHETINDTARGIHERIDDLSRELERHRTILTAFATSIRDNWTLDDTTRRTAHALLEAIQPPEVPW